MLGIVALVAAAANPALASPFSFGAAAGYNVFVFNNFTESGTSVQGTMAVGGNFAPSKDSGITIAGGSSDGAGVYDLVVGGNFTATGYSMGGGSVWVGGNMIWNDPTLPNSAYVVGNFSNSGGGSAGGTIYYAGSYTGPSYISHQSASASSMPTPINFVSAQTNLDSVSAALAGDAANGTVSQSGSTYTLSGTNAILNVFNLSAASYSSATINITAPTGSTVIVNVAGSADSFSGGSINLNGIPSSNVIFNFNSATTLSLSSIAFNATILAPYAAFTGSGGQIDGELIASSAAGNTSFDNDPFSGSLASVNENQASGSQSPPPVPEPSTWLLFLTGAGALALVKKSR
jgi:choice-of-anchor A domain-containing protein